MSVWHTHVVIPQERHDPDPYRFSRGQVMRAWERLRAVLRREQLESEVDEEMRLHIDLATEDYLRRGLTTDEARRLARVKFGSVEASKDALRDARGSVWLRGLFHDSRFALRALRWEPMFTVTAILM